MAWILNGKNPIITNEAEDTFKVVFHKIGRKSDIIKELTKIIQSNESPDIVSIAKFLLGDDKKATKYFQSIGNLATWEKLDADARFIGWGDLKLPPQTLGQGGPATLSFNAGARVGFEIGAEDGEVEPGPLDEAIVRFVLSGTLGGKFALSAPLSFSLGATHQRSLVWEFGYDEEQIVALALANVLTRVSKPFYEMSGVISAFKGPPLDAPFPPTLMEISTPSTMKKLVHAGYTSFSAGAKLSGKHMVPAGALSASLQVTTEIKDDFSLTVTPADDDLSGLRVVVKIGEKDERGLKLTLGYSFGLSMIDADFGKNLLRSISNAGELLDKIEEKGGAAKDALDKYLSPGRSLRGLLDTQVKEFLKDQKEERSALLSTVLTSLLGEEPEKPVDELAVDWLAGQLDQLTQLPTTGDDSLLEAIRANVLADVQAGLQGIIGRLVESALGAVSMEVAEWRKAIATALDTDILEKVLGKSVSDVSTALTTALGQMRQVLNKVKAGVEQAQKELISITWAIERQRWRRRKFDAELIFSADAHAEYQSLMLHPGRTLPALLDGGKAGITVVRNDFEAVFGRKAVDTIALNILGIGLSRSTTLLSQVKVAAKGGVVLVDTDGQLESNRSFGLFKDKDNRRLTISDFLTLEPDSTDSVQPGLLISFSQVEAEWGNDEVKGFFGSFLNNGIFVDPAMLVPLQASYTTARNRQVSPKGKDIKVQGEIGAVLALSQATIQKIINFISQPGALATIRSRAARVLFEVNSGQSNAMRTEVDRWINSKDQSVRGVFDKYHKFSSGVFKEREGFGHDIDFDLLLQEGNKSWVAVMAKQYSDTTQGKPLSANLPYKPWGDFVRLMQKAVEGCDNLPSFFVKLAEASTLVGKIGELGPGGVSGPVATALCEKLEQTQKEAMELLKPWTDVGIPATKDLKSLPLCFFNIMQDLAHHVGEAEETPVVFTVKFAGEEPVSMPSR